jgi:protein associated with RNAse G/E
MMKSPSEKIKYVDFDHKELTDDKLIEAVDFIRCAPHDKAYRYLKNLVHIAYHVGCIQGVDGFCERLELREKQPGDMGRA